MFGSEKYRSFMRHPGANGGGKGGSGSQTVKNEPWKEVQPYLKTAYGTAENLYMNQSPQYYPGQPYANTDPLQTEARQGLEQYARGQMGADVQGMREGYSNLLNSIDVNNNPWLAKAVQGAIRPVSDTLLEQILPSIRSGAINTGQYGGSRQALAEGTAIGKATQAMGDISANMYSNAYQQGLNTVQNAVSQGNNILGLSQSPYTTLDTIGGQYQADDQKAIDAAMNEWNYNQQLPYSQLADYLSLLNGASMYGTQKTSQSGGGSGLLGGLGAALSLGSMFL